MVYLDTLEDTASFIIWGLPPGGLTTRILANRSFEELRRSCHPAVNDTDLKYSIKFIQQNTLNLFEGIDLRTWGGFVPLEPNYEINDFTQETRMLLKLAGKDCLWKALLPQSPLTRDLENIQ